MCVFKSHFKNRSLIPFYHIIFPISIELEIKDTTDIARSASYPDQHFEIDSEDRLRTKLYHKRDDFNFLIVNFPFICSNIPALPAYEVFISQLIRYSRPCSSYHAVLDIWLQLTRKLLNQGFIVVTLRSLLQIVTVSIMTLLTVTEYLSQITTNMLRIYRKLYPVLSSFIAYHRVCTKSNTGVTSGAGTIPDNLSSSPPVFRGVSVARSLVFV